MWSHVPKVWCRMRKDESQWTIQPPSSFIFYSAGKKRRAACDVEHLSQECSFISAQISKSTRERFKTKCQDCAYNAFSVDTQARHAPTTSQLRARRQPRTVSGNARQTKLYKRKQKIAVSPNHLERNRAGRRGSGKGWERRTTQQHSIRARKFSVCVELQRKCSVLEEKTTHGCVSHCSHPPILPHNILPQMCHRAKAPHTRGPSPPPNPRQADHPTESPDQLDLISGPEPTAPILHEAKRKSFC